MHSALDRFETVFNRIIVFFAALVAISIGLMAILISLNLFLLKFKLGNLWWLFGSIEYAMFFGVFIGAPWVLQQGAHVRVDVLLMALPKSIADKLDWFVNLAGTVLCLALCFYGTRAAMVEYVDETMPDKDLAIANWIVLTVFAFAFMMLAIEFLLRMRSERIHNQTPEF